jgi:hypothetical protein
MSDLPPVRTTRTPLGRRVRPGRDEFRAVWPLAVIGGLWVIVIYGILLYESLFQLPLLANTH